MAQLATEARAFNTKKADELKTVKTRNQKPEGLVARLRKEKQTLEAKLEHARTDTTTAYRKIMSEEFAPEIARLEGKLRDSEAQRRTANSETRQLQQQIAELEAKLTAETEAALEKAQAEITALKAAMAEQQQAQAALTAQLERDLATAKNKAKQPRQYKKN